MGTQQHIAAHCTDVLVIGGGGAALRAAIAACEADPSLAVTLVTRGTLGASGVTATACSDRMAFHATLSHTEPVGPEAWRYHAQDIYEIGGEVSDYDLAEILARDSASALDYLDELGVPWVRRSDGAVDQFLTDGSLYPRACYTGPYTANHIEAALLGRLSHLPVTVLDHTMAVDLVRGDEGRVIGAMLLSELTGEASVISARATVLATGGAGRIFASSVFPPDCTGDGYAMAARAGAELVNLEFIQIGLCSVATNLACSGSMMRALPRMVDEDGREFLPEYTPSLSPEGLAELVFAKGSSWPLTQADPAHLVDIVVARELAAGHRVYLDYRRDPQGLCAQRLPEHIQERHTREKGSPLTEAELASPLARLQAINAPSVRWLAERGVDLARGDLLEIAPAAQHFQGGCKIRTDAGTSVPGLYAAGEVAGGQHGANRPGGNALLDSQVFGRIAGRSAATCARAAAAPVDQAAFMAAVEGLCAPEGRAAALASDQIRQQMSALCGVHRTQAGLAQLTGELDELATEGISATGAAAAEAVQAANILLVARLVARAALLRDESRGPHLRFGDEDSLEPLPKDDARWRRYIVLGYDKGRVTSSVREPVRPNECQRPR